jgi:hypothetical protein
MRVPLAAFSLVVAVAGVCGGEGAEERPSPGVVLERFQVNKAGDILLVPVRVGDQERLFMVDTGSSVTVFDDSLLSGQPQRSGTVETSDGKAGVRPFTPPPASVGRLPFRDIQSVVGTDLRWVRECSGHPVYGILGMDFLGRYVIRINFDRGELFILSEASQNSGERISMSRGMDGIPRVRAQVGGW